LIAGDDPAAYEELRSQISAAVRPKDFLEEIWVRDVVDLTWRSLRMRRLKATLLAKPQLNRHFTGFGAIDHLDCRLDGKLVAT
jgi:hypothetical protein